MEKSKNKLIKVLLVAVLIIFVVLKWLDIDQGITIIPRKYSTAAIPFIGGILYLRWPGIGNVSPKWFGKPLGWIIIIASIISIPFIR